jgi:glyoxylase-like metal-dependent hydrolase (beta-lactamase superfamily II)
VAQSQTPDAVLRSALGVFGGEARVRALRSVIVRGGGTEFGTADQGTRPLSAASVAPVAGNAHEEGTIIDVTGHRAANEYRTDRGDGSTRWRRFIYDSTGRRTVDFTSRRLYARQKGDVPEERRELARRVPPLLLIELLDHPDAVRREADTTIAGRAFHVLSYAVPGRAATIHVIIDAATSQVSRIAQLIDYPGLGDAWLATAYGDYVPHRDLRSYPSGHRIQLQGVDYQAVTYSDVRVDDAAAIAETFTIAPDLRQPPPAAPSASPAPAPAPKPQKIAEGVFLVPVGNGDFGLAVEFKDFVLAAEASARLPVLTGVPADDRPGSADLAEGFIAQIHGLIPNKPVRYVVPTHHHGDHAGGVRPFMADGATVITTPGNRGFFEDLGRARLAHNPDRFARAHPPVQIETLAGRRVISDGQQTVELIPFGPNPHTDEMIVLNLPRAGILFQGDLFYYDGEAGFPDPNRLPIMRVFACWVQANALAPSWIYGTHMQAPATMSHIQRILAAAPGQVTDSTRSPSCLRK